MLPGRVSNPGPLTYESDALPIALRGPANNVPYYFKRIKYDTKKWLKQRRFATNGMLGGKTS